eukprot:1365447-Pyramimonas_sp.AAC.1
MRNFLHHVSYPLPHLLLSGQRDQRLPHELLSQRPGRVAQAPGSGRASAALVDLGALREKRRRRIR